MYDLKYNIKIGICLSFLFGRKTLESWGREFYDITYLKRKVKESKEFIIFTLKIFLSHQIQGLINICRIVRWFHLL